MPCLRACHFLSPGNLIPVLSSSRFSGAAVGYPHLRRSMGLRGPAGATVPSHPPCGMAWGRPEPANPARPGARPARDPSGGLTKRQLERHMDRQAEPDRRVRPGSAGALDAPDAVRARPSPASQSSNAPRLLNGVAVGAVGGIEDNAEGGLAEGRGEEAVVLAGQAVAFVVVAAGAVFSDDTARRSIRRPAAPRWSRPTACNCTDPHWLAEVSRRLQRRPQGSRRTRDVSPTTGVSRAHTEWPGALPWLACPNGHAQPGRRVRP